MLLLAWAGFGWDGAGAGGPRTLLFSALLGRLVGPAAYTEEDCFNGGNRLPASAAPCVPSPLLCSPLLPARSEGERNQMIGVIQ